jgi:hypothetical protein
MFEVINLEGGWWGVWLVNPNNPADRYLLTDTFNKRADAEHFKSEFERIANVSKN